MKYFWNFLFLLFASACLSYTNGQLETKYQNGNLLLGRNETFQQNLENLADIRKLINILKTVHQELPVSKSCNKSLENIFGPVLNIKKLTPEVLFELLGKPVGKVLDSWGKPPGRILFGNLAWIGAYDECLGIDGMKHCMVSMVFAGQYPGSYGFCLPKECSTSDLQEVLKFLNTYTHPAIDFQQDIRCNEQVKLDATNKAALSICGIIVLLSLIGTCYDIISRRKIDRKYSEMSNYAEVQPAENSIPQLLKQGEEVSMRLADKPLRHSSRLHDTLMAFSLLKNSSAILATDSPKGAILCVNGIRTISITWVIIGHSYSMVGRFMNAVDNVLPTYKLINNFAFMAISNGALSVDSFFLLSGLLVSYLTIRRLDKILISPMSTIILISKSNLHRYIRLTPSLAFTMLIWNGIMPLLITGPHKQTAQFDVDNWRSKCDKYWWTNILYINNFHPKLLDDECIAWVWYLANDMQFYILSPLFIIPMLLIEKLKFTRIMFRRIASIGYLLAWLAVFLGITAALIGVYNFPANDVWPDSKRQAHRAETGYMYYTKPYTRIPVYLLGLLLGYIFSRKLWVVARYRQVFVFFGWLSAIIVAFFVVYGPYWKTVRVGAPSFSDSENIAYGTLYRVSWAVAVTWVIYACHNKAGGLVNSFLSWKIWIPLSRLTYGTYLLHIFVIVFFFNSNDTKKHYEHSLFAFDLLSITFVSYVCSFLMALFVEYPVLNLEKRFLG